MGNTRRNLIAIYAVAALITLSSADSPLGAEPALSTSFDEEPVSLQVRTGTAHFQVLLHQIDKKQHQFGKGSERISIRCPAGHTAPFAFPISSAPVIEEFRATMWLFCNRPGTQLAATVVLPRSINPATGKPHKLLVRSGQLGLGAQWERLSLEKFPAALARMARVARMQATFPIEERSAFISELVLLVPGGPGMTEVLVDKLEIHGVLGNTVAADATGRRSVQAAENAAKQVRPRVPRVIRWQGEPFQLLARLGFQAVGMTRLPTQEEIAEARQQGLYIVSPPPHPKEITNSGISAEFDQVLFWDLGEQLSENDLGHISRWQELVKRYDNQLQRRTVLAPQRLTREASRIADIVILDRPVLGAGLTLRDYATWMTQRTRLARPGTPTWCRIHTQPTPLQQLQLQGLASDAKLTSQVSYKQLCALVATATGVRSTGYYFDSRSSLAAGDDATQRRAQALELTNLRLGMMEPWLAAGKLQASARSSDPQITALVLQAERSHLLVPISWSSRFDGVIPPANSGPLSLVVPGVAESSDAYLLTLGGPQRLRHERVAGGVRVSLDQLPSDGLILLSDDPTAISQVARYLRQVAPRATQLKRQLAQNRLNSAAQVYASMPEGTVQPELLKKTLASAQESLRDCDAAIAARNYEVAYRYADSAETIFSGSDHQLWQRIVGRRASAELPLAMEFQMLPALLRWKQFPAASSRAPNLLPAGGFESLEVLVESGWRHRQLPTQHVTTAVRLSPQTPQHGSYCLELEARPADPAAPPPILATAPVWIVSKPIQLEAGTVVEISGAVRVPQELLGSVDGLQIFDSLGGAELATRIKAAPTWQPFRMVRMARDDEAMSITIALTGLGVAQVDNLAVRPLASQVPRQLSVAPGPFPVQAR